MSSKILSIVVLFFCVRGTIAYSSEDIVTYEIDPFLNFFIKYDRPENQRIKPILNPKTIDISQYKIRRKLDGNSGIYVKALKGETIYKGLLLKNISSSIEISADILPDNKASITSNDVDIDLVTSWYQSGNATSQSKKKMFLTHELLLNNDFEYSFKDSWVKKYKKWYYNPPIVNDDSVVTTNLSEGDTRRLLIKINIPIDIKSNDSTIYVNVWNRRSGKLLIKVPIIISVLPVELETELSNGYDLFIFTMLSLDPMVARRNKLINGQNTVGNYERQKRDYKERAIDIVRHGFNGVIICDWRKQYVEDALEILQEAGIKNVAVRAVTSIEKNKKIVRAELIDSFKKFGFEPIFFGYDEHAGGKKMMKQIALNKEINLLGAKSFNAMHWDGRKRILNEAKKNDHQEFSFLAYSMGSHGNKEFLNQLPLVNVAGNMKQMAYWHPHVETPVRNRLFMGFWLWASGLDGVVPHTYYTLPHISMTKKPDWEGDQTISPYNDFGFWSGSGIFRQHSTVYFKQNGIVSTLQWEGVRDGYTDLVLVSQLEKILKNLTERSRDALEAENLLTEIRKAALVKNSSRIKEAQRIGYVKKMNAWRSQIKDFINKLSATS